MNAYDRTGKGTVAVNAFAAKIEATAGASSSHQHEIFEKSAPYDEPLLLEVEDSLVANGELNGVHGVRDIAELRVKGHGTFVMGMLRFRWASTFNTDPVQDAVQKQMIEFEVDRDAQHDAGMLSVPVRMAGSLEKCVNRKNLHDGSLSPTIHLPGFLREIARDTLPFGFIAHMQSSPRLVYLKPYAIWFP